MEDRVLTPKQVADYLQISCASVYHLIRKGELPAKKAGRVWRITDDDFSDYLIAHSAEENIQDAMFRRILEIGQRNPDVDGDELLEWLEEQDELPRS